MLLTMSNTAQAYWETLKPLFSIIDMHSITLQSYKIFATFPNISETIFAKITEHYRFSYFPVFLFSCFPIFLFRLF